MSAPTAFPALARGVAVLLLLAGACATPARRLPARQVDDPITLPARVFELGVGAIVTPNNEQGEIDGEPIVPMRYGITDRLTLLGLLALELALLDDAPVASAATGDKATASPLGLSLAFGLAGIGYSSSEGLIVHPLFGLRAVKHLSPSLRLESDVHWIGRYSRWHDEALLFASVGATIQLVDRLALTFAVGDRMNFQTFLPTDQWGRNVLFAGPWLEYRPWHWVTGGLGGRVDAAQRSSVTVAPVVPDDPRPRLASQGTWSIWFGAALTFYW